VEQRAAIHRLLAIAQADTGQSRRVADFLLAWHNAEDNGGWDPTDLWAVDEQIAADMLTVLNLIANARVYPPDLGFDAEIQTVWRMWRGEKHA
jgi:hypothetical protein